MYPRFLSNTFRRMKIKTCLNILILISCVTILVTVRHILTGSNKIDVKKADSFLRTEIPIPTKSKVEWCSAVIDKQGDSNSNLVEDLFSLVRIISIMHNNFILDLRMLIKK